MSNTEQEKVQLFDFGLWCAVLRNQRKKIGFDKASDFTAALWDRVRVKMTPATFYKIEQGKQEPSLTQYMGINLLLFNDFTPTPEIYQLCICEEWKETKEILNDEEEREIIVANDWAIENYNRHKEEFNQIVQPNYDPTPYQIEKELGVPSNTMLCLNPYAGT